MSQSFAEQFHLPKEQEDEYSSNPRKYGLPDDFHSILEEEELDYGPTSRGAEQSPAPQAGQGDQDIAGQGGTGPDLPTPGHVAAEAYAREREALLEQKFAARERELREREERLNREAAMFSAVRGNSQPQMTDPDIPDNPFDRAVDERVNARLAPFMQQYQQNQEKQALAMTLQSMVEQGRSNPNMPEFDRIAGLGSDMIGQNAALEILRSNNPVDAAQKLYTIGLGAVRQRGEQISGGQPLMTPSQFSRPFSPPPRGMSLQQGGGGQRQPSFQQLDEYLASDDLSHEEYEKFSREHPDVLKRYLQNGTTDPTYVPRGDWGRLDRGLY